MLCSHSPPSPETPSKRDGLDMNTRESKVMSVEEAMARVASIDLSKVKRKLRNRDGWSADDVAEGEQLYRKYLALILAYPDRRLSPSRIMDEFWHAHILDTKAYTADCERVLGRYLHHVPSDGGQMDILDAVIMRALYKETCDLFLKHFDITL